MTSVAFSGDGARLAVGDAEGGATIWDLGSGNVVIVAPLPGRPVLDLSFAADGRLATASTTVEPRAACSDPKGDGEKDNLVAIWDRAGKRLWEQKLEGLRWIGFRPMRDELAIVAWDQMTLRDRKGVELERMASMAWCSGGAWSADGAALVFPSGGGVLVKRGGDWSHVLHDVKLDLAGFHPNGRLVAAADAEGKIAVVDLATGAATAVFVDDVPTPPRTTPKIAWSPDGGMIASATGSTLTLFDPTTTARLAAITAHAPIAAFSFRPDGRTIAIGCRDGTVELRAVANGDLVAALAIAGERGAVLAPDGRVDGDPRLHALPLAGSGRRTRTANLLAMQLAAVPADRRPRPGTAGSAPARQPPACVPVDAPAGERRAASTWDGAPDGTVALCVDSEADHELRPPSPPHHAAHLPICFAVDAASGAYRPRRPTPDEALRRRTPSPVTVTAEPSVITACRGGACKKLAVPELSTYRPGAGDQPPQTTVDATGKHLGVLISPMSAGEANPPRQVLIYDLASGARVGRVPLGVGSGFDDRIEFLDNLLLVTTELTCHGCARSRIFDPRTATLLATIGGAKPLDTSKSEPARVAGDVYAFDGETELVVQNIRTGRLVARIASPHPGGRLASTSHGVAVIATGGDQVGDVAIVDANGRVTARHALPRCGR